MKPCSSVPSSNELKSAGSRNETRRALRPSTRPMTRMRSPARFKNTSRSSSELNRRVRWPDSAPVCNASSSRRKDAFRSFDVQGLPHSGAFAVDSSNSATAGLLFTGPVHVDRPMNHPQPKATIRTTSNHNTIRSLRIFFVTIITPLSRLCREKCFPGPVMRKMACRPWLIMVTTSFTFLLYFPLSTLQQCIQSLHCA